MRYRVDASGAALVLAALLLAAGPPTVRGEMVLAQLQMSGTADAQVINEDGTTLTLCRDPLGLRFPDGAGTPLAPSFDDTATCDRSGAGFRIGTTARIGYNAAITPSGGALQVTSFSFTAHLTGDTTVPDPVPPSGGTEGRALAGAFINFQARTETSFHITVAPATGSRDLDSLQVSLETRGSLTTQNERVLSDTLPRDGTVPPFGGLTLNISLLLNPAGRTASSKVADVTVTITFSSGARGACCLAGGGCSEVTLTECAALGDFKGPSTTCGGSVCVASEDFVNWVNGGGGTFGVPGNWEPASVPGEKQTARFLLPGRYVVTGATGRIRRAVVGGGTVTLQGGSLQLLDISLATPSVAIGDGGRLNLTVGTLRSSHVSVGTGGVVSGMGVSGAGTRWESSGRVTIGNASVGDLTVAEGGTLVSAEARIGESDEGDASVEGEGSSWRTGNIAVGRAALGTLQIEGGGVVTSGEAELGLMVPGAGTVEVLGKGATGLSSLWQVDTLRVGSGSPGSLVLDTGGTVVVAHLTAVGDQGQGTVTVRTKPSGLETTQLVVGGRVDGSVDVSAGGRVIAADTRLGQGDGEGDVTVSGSESIFSSPTLTVRRGTMRLDDGSELESGTAVVTGPAANVVVSDSSVWRVLQSLQIGGPDGPGKVTLDDGLMEVAPGGFVLTTPRGTLAGTGLVSIGAGSLPFKVTQLGTISPGVQVFESVARFPARPLGARPAAVGAGAGELTIQGDLSLGSSAVVRVPVAGSGRSGVLHVTGTLARGGTLEFDFVGGYLPKTGDVIEPLRVDGAIEGDFVAVRIRGVADDFLFDVDTAGGVTRLTARSDAGPAGCADGNDNDGDGLVDCADAGCAGSAECAAPGGEICGNCVDDDGNGLTDFEDQACCGGAAPAPLQVRSGAIKPQGGASKVALNLAFAGAGDPAAQDVFLQLAPDGAAPVLCARMPAARIVRKGKRFQFVDRAAAVETARGLRVVTLQLRKQGAGTLKAKARAASVVPPAAGMLRLTVGFHDAGRGEVESRCASGVRGFRGGKKGALVVR